MAKKGKKEKKVEEKKASKEPAAEEAEAEEVGKYAFPMAAVVREMRKHLHNKMISAKVKVAMNLFLADMVRKVTEDMDKSRYSMVEMDDFQKATQKFIKAEDLEAEKDRIVSHLDAIRSDVEAMMRELDRKFDIEAL